MSSRNNRGVITILVSLLLTGILSVGTLVLEAGRYQAAKTQLSEANISAGTSMIASYDADLYNRYGLLVIDNEVANAGRYGDYLAFNSDLAAGYEGNNISTMYGIDNYEFETLYNLTYPSVMKRQLLARSKFNIIPQDYSLNTYNADYFLQDIVNKADSVIGDLTPSVGGTAAKGSRSDIPGGMQNALNSLYNTFKDTEKFDDELDVRLTSSSVAILPSTTGTIDSNIHSEDMDLINSSVSDAQTVIGSHGSLLSSAGAKPYTENDISGVSVSFIGDMGGKYVAMDTIGSKGNEIAKDCQKLVNGIKQAITVLRQQKDENLYLNSYIVGYFPSRNTTVNGYSGPAKGTTTNGTVPEMTFAGACVEYVISGTTGEKYNQNVAYDYAFAMRLIGNLYSVFEGSTSFNNQNSANVAAHIAWAYYETYVDMELLSTHYATVPYNKYNMILPVNDTSKVASAFSSGKLTDAMKSLGIMDKDNKVTVEGTDATTYKDALALGLWIVPNSKKLARISDLVQLEMRYKEKYVDKESVSFLLSDCDTFCRVKCTAKLNTILPIISLGTNSGPKGISFGSVKYVGY